MTNRHLRFISLITILVLTVAAHADHPNIARGFDVGKPYQMNGIDNINLFNGNLTVTLPIGQRYHVNGGLGYGLTLVYSGNVWDTVNLDTITCNGHPTYVTRTYPNRMSNAGLGWLLSLGRLFPRNQYPTQDSPYWQYESPDGALHSFHQGLHGAADPDYMTNPDPSVSYTRDGTYLRMTKTTNDRTIEFPDGTSQVFKELDNTAGSPWPVSAGSGRWRLIEIHDRFNNVVGIDYSSTADNPEIWTIHDGTRTQTVYFIDPRTLHSGSPYDVTLDRVVLSVLNGVTAEWRPAYAWRTVAPGAANQGCNGSSIAWPNVPLLTSLTLPPVNNVSQVYSMTAPDGSPYYTVNSNAFNIDPFNGHLKGLQLPTHGWIEWDYRNFIFYAGTQDRMSRSIAVSGRRTVGANRVTTATWTYGRQSSGNLSCTDNSTDPDHPVPVNERPEQLVVSVTSPEQVTSVHYFSTYQQTVFVCNTGATYNEEEYALPLSHGVSQAGVSGPLYLSEEIYSTPPASLNTSSAGYRVTGGTRVRSEWVSYTYDGSDGQGGGRNERESAHVTSFEDDANCSGTCYASVSRYGFDGAGHFRQSSTAVISRQIPRNTGISRQTTSSIRI